MRKLLLALALAFGLGSPAFAQNTTCTTRPLNDKSNACASTAFVQNALAGSILLPHNHIFVGNSAGVAVDYGTLATFSDNGTLAINPTANSLTQGIFITQSGTGTASAASPSGTFLGYAYNRILITDNVTSTNAGADPVYGLHIQVTSNGSSTHGNGALFAGSILSGTPANNAAIAGVTGYANSTVNVGGTGVAPLGYIYGGSFYGSLVAANAFYQNVTGAEFDVQVVGAGSAVVYKSGIQVVQLISDSIQGSTFDGAISISNGGGGAGWKNGILFSNANGSQPMASNGVLFATQGSSTITTGIDISSYTFTNKAFVSTGASIDPTGIFSTSSYYQAFDGTSQGFFGANTTFFAHDIALGTLTNVPLAFFMNNTLYGSMQSSGWNFIKQATFNTASTIASAAGAALDDINVQAATSTITGTTTITKLNKVGIYRPTYTDASAVTVSDAATVYIDNSPLAAGSVTITRPWALWAAGGNILFGSAPPVPGIIGYVNINSGSNNNALLIGSSVSNTVIGTYYSGPTFFYKTLDATNNNTQAIDYRGVNNNSYATIVAQITDQTSGAVKGKFAFGVANGTSAASNFVYIENSGGMAIGIDSDPGAGALLTNTFVKATSYLQTGAVTVASLPTCNAGAKAERYFVTDANATFTAGIGAVVAAGGANNVPVTCDGTSWRIGANDNFDLQQRKYA